MVVRHIIRLGEVIRVTGLSRTSVYRLMSQGKFPRSVPISQGSVGWIEAEVADYISARIAERDSMVAA